jgi:hypothetical protein
MKELTDQFEIEKYKEELDDHRKIEQMKNKDYDYDHKGNIEYCSCGRPLNSHGWCFRCDG